MIIGLSGYKQSGKTTLANRLATRGFKKVSFKDGLIAEMMDTLPDVLRAMCYEYGTSLDKLFKDKPIVMRALMQNYGTNLRRNEDNDYWVNIWKESVSNTKGNIVVDDVRFKNEAQAVKDAGGILIRVIKEGQVNTDPHQSEVEHLELEYDFTISAPEGQVQTLLDGLQKSLDVVTSNVD